MSILEKPLSQAGAFFADAGGSRRRRWLHSILFLAAMSGILAASAFLYNTQERILSRSAQYERSERLQRDLLVVTSSLKDVETGARGYTLTGDETYLEPYEIGKEEVARELDNLAGLVGLAGGDAAQRRNIEEVIRLARTRVDLADRLVALTRATGPGIDPGTFSTLEQGRVAMDRVRQAVDSAVGHERSRNQGLNGELQRQVWLRNVTAAIAMVLGLPTMLLLFLTRNREIARRTRTELELKELTGDLENRVATSTAGLKRSAGILDLVLRNIPDTVFLIDARDDHRNVIWSHIVGQDLDADFVKIADNVTTANLPPEVIASLRAEDEHILATRQAATTIFEDIQSPEGPRTVEFRRIPVQDHEGNWRYLLSIARDITDQRTLEHQVRHGQRLEAIGQLTGGIAHDFNNLLAVIMGNCDLLRERLDDDSELAGLANEVIGAAEHGAELTRSLLAFARKQYLRPTSLDLNGRLPEIVPLLQRTLGADIGIRVSRGDGLWPARVDPGQVDDALINLAINSRDAMPDGGHLVIETANVTLGEDYAAEHLEVKPGDYVLLSVSDSGSGMPPDVAARAFEPFFTTKGVGRGTGLGLSQIYGWVKQSGGHIKIYSEVGHGTTIKLYLPCATEDAEEVDQAAPVFEIGPTGDESILVVEDNSGLRRVVLQQLQDLGYSTLEAEDAKTALQMIQSGIDCHLVFADVVMPGGMTGYELARILSETHPDLKILLTSGYTELAARIGNGDFDKYRVLSKPYRKTDLANAVRTLLDG